MDPVRLSDRAQTCTSVRLFVVRPFPDLVVTALIAEEQLVVAVAHTRREPGYWTRAVEPRAGALAVEV